MVGLLRLTMNPSPNLSFTTHWMTFPEPINKIVFLKATSRRGILTRETTYHPIPSWIYPSQLRSAGARHLTSHPSAGTPMFCTQLLQTWRKCSRDLARLLSNQSGSSPIRKSVQKKDKRAAGELQHRTEIRKTRVRQRREYHDEDTRGHWLPQFALSQESSHTQQSLTARGLQFELSNLMPVPEYDLSTLVHPENPPESQAV